MEANRTWKEAQKRIRCRGTTLLALRRWMHDKRRDTTELEELAGDMAKLVALAKGKEKEMLTEGEKPRRAFRKVDKVPINWTSGQKTEHIKSLYKARTGGEFDDSVEAAPSAIKQQELRVRRAKQTGEVDPRLPTLKGHRKLVESMCDMDQFGERTLSCKEAYETLDQIFPTLRWPKEKRAAAGEIVAYAVQQQLRSTSWVEISRRNIRASETPDGDNCLAKLSTRGKMEHLLDTKSIEEFETALETLGITCSGVKYWRTKLLKEGTISPNFPTMRNHKRALAQMVDVDVKEHLEYVESLGTEDLDSGQTHAELAMSLSHIREPWTRRVLAMLVVNYVEKAQLRPAEWIEQARKNIDKLHEARERQKSVKGKLLEFMRKLKTEELTMTLKTFGVETPALMGWRTALVKEQQMPKDFPTPKYHQRMVEYLEALGELWDTIPNVPESALTCATLLETAYPEVLTPICRRQRVQKLVGYLRRWDLMSEGRVAKLNAIQVMAAPRFCKGRTPAGGRCKRYAKEKSEYCARHGPTENADINVSAEDDEKKEKCSSDRCQGITQKGHVEVVKVLPANGADKNAKDKDGWTPLHWASIRDHVEVVKVLLANGADKNAKDNFGRTPLDRAKTDEMKRLLR